MSALYLVALCAFSLVVLALVGEAVWSVARPPQWQTYRRDAGRARHERRTQNLPFVGTERRVAAATPPVEQPRAAPDEIAQRPAKAA